MAVTTLGARVSIAKYLKNKINSTYIGIGGTEPWENEEEPPEPAEDTKELLTPIMYRKVDKVSLCREVDSEEEATYATIEYRGKLWELVPDIEAEELGATYVYFEAYFRGTMVPSGEYRQVGIFTGLEPRPGADGQYLYPEQVSDTGLLEMVENRVRHNRTPDTNVLERFIINVTERR